jgi:hypothetical protein
MKLFPKPDPIPFALILLTFLITVLTSAEVDTWVFTVPVCLIGFIFYIAHLRAKKRTEAMRALAESLEMEFEAEKFHPSKLGIDGIDLFEKGRSQKVINLIKGTFEDTNTFIFDYHYLTGGGKNSAKYLQTVIAFKIRSKYGFKLPQFTCKPERFYHRFADVFGFKDIDFEEYPVFSKAYRLNGDRGDTVRKIFNETVIRKLEAESKQRWNVDGSGEWLVIHKNDRIIEPEDCPKFLRDSKNLHDAMMLTYRGYSGLPNATFATLKRTSDGN